MYLQRSIYAVFSNINMTGAAFKAIISHLVDMEERKNEIINDFYPEISEERARFCYLIESYLKRLEGLVTKVKVIERPTRDRIKELDYLPFVIIGSTIILEDLKSGNLCSYKVVSPYHVSKLHTDISYLSHFGKKLLLKKAGDEVSININGDENSFRIKSIRYELF